MRPIIEKIKTKKHQIENWLLSLEDDKELPLYTSVDIRDSGFKMAVVDTNLFPAGFNNLCEHGIKDSVGLMREAILKRVPECEDVLIIAEEHTRNTWYLENIRILQSIIEQAGFRPKIATFIYLQPPFCHEANYVELETATGQPVKIYCFQRLIRELKNERAHFDLIIMNNDLIAGIPEFLKNSNIPTYPSIQAGWHSRHKSLHFKYANEVISEFAKIIDADPWFFSCLDTVVSDVNVNSDGDRAKLADAAKTLFEQIKTKYKEHHINEKPFIFLKADAGTYGMGVMPIENPQEMIDLNRKNRNKLYKGKGSQVIDRYLLQEGVATFYTIDHQTSEVCLYQITNHLVGGFYRMHAEKTSRDNLNSQGMDFKKMCPHPVKYPDCGVEYDADLFSVYAILSRVATIAAYREVLQLEAVKK